MKRIWQFIFVCAVALLVTSVLSHAAVRWLGIKATAKGYRVFGSEPGKPAAILYGSSPAFDGLDWDQIAQRLGGGVENWTTAGSSPCEWEMMEFPTPEPHRTFIAVSLVDLNEYFLCDFRAELVPFTKTVRELRAVGADWSFSKRILNQYPLMFTRILFPTAGRSDGVMVGIRRELQKWIGNSHAADEERVPLLGYAGPNMTKDRIADWEPARLQRRLELMRTRCEGKQWFEGPKKQALLRLVHEAAARGEVTIVVMPMSPIYQRELMTPAATTQFERALAEAQAAGANSPMIRLDELPALRNNDVFWDFVHLNMNGQRIATAALLRQL